MLFFISKELFYRFIKAEKCFLRRLSFIAQITDKGGHWIIDMALLSCNRFLPSLHLNRRKYPQSNNASIFRALAPVKVALSLEKTWVPWVARRARRAPCSASQRIGQHDGRDSGLPPSMAERVASAVVA